MNEFDYDVEHVRGVNNIVAYTFSRYPPDMYFFLTSKSVHIVVVSVVGFDISLLLFCASCIEDLREQFKDLKW